MYLFNLVEGGAYLLISPVVQQELLKLQADPLAWLALQLVVAEEVVWVHAGERGRHDVAAHLVLAAHGVATHPGRGLRADVVDG